MNRKKMFKVTDAKKMTKESRVEGGTIGFLRLQNKVVNAIQDACLHGVSQATVSTSDNTLALAVKRVLEEAGYYVYLEKGNGLLGDNLVYLPRTYITVRWENV